MSAPLDELDARYGEHHRTHRDAGEFVFVPERVPLFRAAVGGPGVKVLDLGCRTGAVTRHFLPGNDVTGLDVDSAALAVAERLGIRPVHADVERPLPFDDGAFDAVVAGELLEHVRFPDDVVGEIRRVLRPGGVLVGSVPNAFRLFNRLRFLSGLPPERDPTHLHMFRPGDLRMLLAGFDDVTLALIAGRFTRLSEALMAQDMVFRGTRPAA